MTATGQQPTQLEFWNSVSAQRWAEHYASLDRTLKPFSEASLAKAAPQAGERALDVGTGCGETLLLLAAAVGPSGGVHGVDISAPMLARARERAGSLPHVRITEADAAVHRFESPFDLIYSRFGIMFFEDPNAAFKNLREALKQSGRIAFVCWRPPQENPWMVVPMMAMKSAWPDAPPMQQTDGPGPFAFADPDKVRLILESARFGGVVIERYDAEFVLGATAAEAAEFATRIGPASRMLADASPEVRERVRGAIASALGPYVKNGRCALMGSTWIVTAKAS